MTKEASFIGGAHGLKLNGDRVKHLSLFSGEAGKTTLGRFPDLGFFLLAAPSHPSLDSGQWLSCGFRSHHSGGCPPGLLPAFPTTPTTLQKNVAKSNTRSTPPMPAFPILLNRST